MATPVRLTILQLNDLHGYLEPHAELVRAADGQRHARLGGLARIASLFARVREETGGEVIALDNGDTFHGTFAAVHDRGEGMVELMNALDFDAMTLHWKFAYGPRHVRELGARLRYPMLARGSEEADLVVVLSHLGFPQDVKLAREVDGIDVLVSGHTHNRMHAAAIENGAIIFQSGCHGSFAGRLDVEVRGGRIASHRHELVPIDERLPEEAAMRGRIARLLAPHREKLEEVVGESASTLDRYSMYQATMDDVLLDAVAADTGLDLAFSNGWRYGAPIPVTMNDVWNVIPTDPPVGTVVLTGAEIRAMLEASLERTFAADAFRWAAT